MHMQHLDCPHRHRDCPICEGLAGTQLDHHGALQQVVNLTHEVARLRASFDAKLEQRTAPVVALMHDAVGRQLNAEAERDVFYEVVRRWFDSVVLSSVAGSGRSLSENERRAQQLLADYEQRRAEEENVDVMTKPAPDDDVVIIEVKHG